MVIGCARLLVDGDMPMEAVSLILAPTTAGLSQPIFLMSVQGWVFARWMAKAQPSRGSLLMRNPVLQKLTYI